MNEKVTPIQVEILKALREHKGRGTKESFSMDELYFKFYSDDVDRDKFQESYHKLMSRDYVKRVPGPMDEKGDVFGGYEITELGLQYLRDISE